jgi:ribulose-phosphate 3-epimerase
MKAKIYPSLLAADMGCLQAEAKRAEDAGAEALHLDIMDGHFVPNISMGPAVVEMANRSVGIPLNVHLMLTHPDRYIDVFAAAGADSILIHIEAACNVPGTLRRLREMGVRPGITLNPKTPAESIRDVIMDVDEVLCMTVEPGYGGQVFMDNVLPKIRSVRTMVENCGRSDLDILVDGGINIETAGRCADCGANAFVAGTYLYAANNMAGLLSEMRKAAQAALDHRSGPR